MRGSVCGIRNSPISKRRRPRGERTFSRRWWTRSARRACGSDSTTRSSTGITRSFRRIACIPCAMTRSFSPPAKAATCRNTPTTCVIKSRNFSPGLVRSISCGSIFRIRARGGRAARIGSRRSCSRSCASSSRRRSSTIVSISRTPRIFSRPSNTSRIRCCAMRRAARSCGRAARRSRDHGATTATR